MRDALESQLVATLHRVAESVPDVVDPPPDLELRVARRRRQAKTGSRFALSAIAAVIVAVIAAVAAIAAMPRDQSRSVPAVGPRDPKRLPDPLPPGAVLLDSRGPYVVALDAGGHQLATLVSARRGDIIDAQLTRDHQTLWYLSVAGRGGADCGEVVRAEIATGVSTIVAHAVSFAISPDGSRLALAGGGIGRGTCDSLARVPPRAEVVVTETTTGAMSSWVDTGRTPTRAFNQMRWSADGRHIVTRLCTATCEPLVVFDVPDRLGSPLRSRVVDRSGFLGMRPPASFGDAGLYVLERNVAPVWKEHRQSVEVFDGATFRRLATLLTVDARWDLISVIPAGGQTFVLGIPRDDSGAARGPRALYRIQGGKLVEVRAFDYGTLTAVPAAA